MKSCQMVSIVALLSFIPLLRVGAFLPRMRIDAIPYITPILLFSFHDAPLTHLYSYSYTIPNATRPFLGVSFRSSVFRLCMTFKLTRNGADYWNLEC